MYDVYLFDDTWRYSNDFPWWINFLDQIDVRARFDIAFLNQFLKEHNARFYTTKDGTQGLGERHVVFDSEADFSMFVLRWS